MASDKSELLPNGRNHHATEAIKKLSVKEAIKRLSACPHGSTVLTGDFNKSGLGDFGDEVLTFAKFFQGSQAEW